MIWLGTILALFLGGFIGHTVGAELGAPIIGMLTGAIVFALSYKPREVLVALREAVRAVVEVDYLGITWMMGRAIFRVARATISVVLPVVLFCVAGLVVSWSYFALLLSSIPGVLPVNHPESLAAPFSMVLGVLAYLIGLVYVETEMKMKFPTGDLSPQMWYRFGLLVLLSGFVGFPLFTSIFITRSVPAVVRKIPEIAWLFARLIATHDRLAGMSAVAAGVLIGLPLGIPALTGLIAISIGVPMIMVSKFVVKNRTFAVTAGSS